MLEDNKCALVVVGRPCFDGVMSKGQAADKLAISCSNCAGLLCKLQQGLLLSRDINTSQEHARIVFTA